MRGRKGLRVNSISGKGRQLPVTDGQTDRQTDKCNFSIMNNNIWWVAHFSFDNEVLSKINLALVIKNYFKNWTKLGHCSISFENLFDPYNDLTNIQDIVCHPIFAECLISTRQLILHWIWLREYIHACVGVSVTLQECNSHYAIA